MPIGGIGVELRGFDNTKNIQNQRLSEATAKEQLSDIAIS